MTVKSISITLASLIVFSLSTAQAARSKRGTGTTTSEARATLKDIDRQAFSVADEADHLSLFSANMAYSPEAHIEGLETVKDDVNRMVREINQLEAEHDVLAPWEQHAVDETLPLLNETAMKTQKAIEYFDANRNLLWTGEYREDTNEIRKDSEQIAKTLKDYLKYEKVSNEEQQLKQNMGTPGE